LVPLAGIEPALLAELDFESSASTNSATGACRARPEPGSRSGRNIAGADFWSTRAYRAGDEAVIPEIALAGTDHPDKQVITPTSVWRTLVHAIGRLGTTRGPASAADRSASKPACLQKLTILNAAQRHCASASCKSDKEHTMAQAAQPKKAVDYEAKRTRDHDNYPAMGRAARRATDYGGGERRSSASTSTTRMAAGMRSWSRCRGTNSSACSTSAASSSSIRNTPTTGISVDSINPSMPAPKMSRIRSCEPGRAVAGSDGWPERQHRRGSPRRTQRRAVPGCRNAPILSWERLRGHAGTSTSGRLRR
jgi:hypothetical protein